MLRMKESLFRYILLPNNKEESVDYTSTLSFLFFEIMRDGRRVSIREWEIFYVDETGRISVSEENYDYCRKKDVDV